jgi:TPR repeat protein
VKLLTLRDTYVLPIACMLLMAALLAGCDSGKPHFDAPRAYMPAADIYGQALDYMAADDWPGATPLLKEASEKGNAQAKYQLGLLYARGEHVAQDLDKARELLLDAGKLGYAAPYPIPDEHADAWMVQELTDGAIGAVSGTVICADALNKPEHWRE